MKELYFRRMENRLNEIFLGKIYDEDIKGKNDYQIKWNSRAYTAYVINMIGSDKAPLSANYVTDGINDNGIDAIYDDKENQKLVFIQTKFSQNKSIDDGELNKFLNGVKRLMNLDFSNCNKRILDRKIEIESALLKFDYSIELLIALGSDQSLSQHTKQTLDEFIKKVNDNEGLISYRVIKFSDVYNHMADSSTLEKISIDNFYLENYGTLKKENGATVYYGIVSAESIAKLKDKFGNQIFQKNIRYFKKNTDVNNGIVNVLNEEPENFYLYNNGIKIIAEKIDKAPIGGSDRNIAILRLEGISIINGAQTTGCLYEVYKSTPEKIRDAKVQVQLISLTNLDSNMAEKITKLSNTQNKIENKDFAVQDPVQEQLKRDLAIDGIKYIYKQGEDDTELTDCTCNIDDAAIALGCSLPDVNITTTIKRAYGSIFDDLSKPPYKLIFNSGVSPHRLWNVVRIFRIIKEIEEQYQKDTSKSETRLISVHGNRMILHIILNKFIKKNKDFDKKYINTFNNIELTYMYEQTVLELYNKKNELYPDAYPAYIFKNSKKCKELESQIFKIE